MVKVKKISRSGVLAYLKPFLIMNDETFPFVYRL
ncbi:hypothetical protein HBHAL_4856 [Halobacillus halophilus DSM 2266]|uniref:Uncharacterized protein n=1 Tax=Halobacillus halophilus (strain ATCC 35676 / DSM 2266 / JCM 20832 / KCTC 3685 / LMG 17431 / NBRC 102448 / NCIMB 2269) TaxID=866895 RepID=I0JSS2_HALH3|nr:hypothetical protein HBHAL_4856 [Halobacillus halophilus DSM 2266]